MKKEQEDKPIALTSDDTLDVREDWANIQSWVSANREVKGIEILEQRLESLRKSLAYNAWALVSKVDKINVAVANGSDLRLKLNKANISCKEESDSEYDLIDNLTLPLVDALCDNTKEELGDFATDDCAKDFIFH